MVRLWALFLILLGIATLVTPAIWGWNYYTKPMEQRVRLPSKQKEFRSGGTIGHGYGIAGSILMLLNFLYLYRKRLGRRAEWMGSMRAWMHFHVFVGLTGPILVFYHTAFVMRNIFAQVSLFSMLIVVATGIVGRFVYATIPRDLKGYSQDRSTLVQELHNSTQAIETTGASVREKLEHWFPQPQLVNRYAVSLVGVLLWERVSYPWKKFRCKQLLMKEYNTPKESSKTLAVQWLQSRKLMYVIEVLERHQKAFASWRNIHRSLTYVMLLTAIVHTFIATVGFGLL